jgi:predicted ATPase with chaperone activity
MQGYPCGIAGDPTRPCSRSPAAITRDQKPISGPLLSRIDIHLEVPRIEFGHLTKRFGEHAAVDDMTFAVPRGSSATQSLLVRPTPSTSPARVFMVPV